MATIAADPSVELVEPNYELQILTTPNDPYFNNLWGLHNIQQSGGYLDADIDAPEAWDYNTGDPSVIVAVIDTGVDYNHEDLAANMWVNPGEIPDNGIDDDGNGYIDDIHGYDFYNRDSDPFDDQGHGTHCSGTIAGVGNNGIGVAGVGWNTKIMAIKFMDSYGHGNDADAIDGIIYAINNGAKVMSNSWGGGPFSQALLDAINAANDAGVLFVAAAGNTSRDNDIYPTYPANYAAPNVFAVAATDYRDNKAGFSNYGAQTVHLGAPGVNIFSTLPTGGCSLCSPSGYGYLSGTSMATPHVAGAAALLLAKNPGFTVEDLKTILMDNADPIPSMTGTTISGGRLNIGAAMAANTDFSVTFSPASQGILAGETTTYTLTVRSRGSTTQQITLAPGTLAPGINASLADVALTPPVGGTVTTTLTVTAGASVPRGDYTISVAASDESGALVNNATVQLSVLYPDLDLTLTPAATVVPVGDAATFDLILTSIDSYSDTLGLSVTTSDPRITASISPSSVTLQADGTATASVTLNVDAATPNQTYTLTTTVAGSGISKSADAQITVVDTDLSMTAVTASVSETSVRETITINSIVANQGAAATTDQTRVGYYLSVDATIDTNDIFLGEEVVSAVAGNGSVNLSTAVVIPANLQVGAYYVGAIADYTNQQPEVNETNNVLVGTSTLQINQIVDLVPTAFSVPAGDIYTGSPITLTATVANLGSGIATSNSHFSVGVYLSTDAVITTTDTLLGSQPINGMLGNTSRDISLSINLPDDQTPGTYYIGMIVDHTDLQAEIDETNNTSAAVQRQVIRDVDLTPTAFNVPAGDKLTGNSLTLTATITNQGNSGTTTNFNATYYLSTDAAITSADTPIGSNSFSGFGAGATRDLTTNVTIPADLTAGTYYIGVLVDSLDWVAETDESNNTSESGPYQINRDIDLTPTALNLPAGEINAGTPISLTNTITNQGGSPSTYFYVTYYLSSDATITTADIPLGSRSVGYVGAGASVDFSQTVTISANQAPGTYYVGMVVDSSNLQAETDETNNTLAVQLQVAGSLDIDLTPTAFNVPAGDINTGSTLTLASTIANQGSSASTGFSVDYYLSTDATISTTDTLIGSSSVSSLGAGASLNLTQDVAIPASQPSGAYYVGILVDSGNSQVETNETNNTSAVQRQVVGSESIDLIPTAMNAPAGDYNTGSSFNVTSTIANQGNSSTSSYFYVGYYLSTDAEITAADTRIGFRQVNSLGAGATLNLSDTVTVSAGITPGNYYIGMIVDYTNSQLEADESNNTFVAGQHQVTSSIDLTPTAFNAPAGDYFTGSSFNVTATIANQGNSSTSSYFYVGYYLSTDAEITSADTRIGYRKVNSLGAGATLDLSDTVSLFPGQPQGTYYIGMIVDYLGSQPELDEGNNTIVAGQHQVISGIDLTPTAFNAPTGNISAGSTITLSATIANQGVSQTGSYFYVGYYLSTDAKITTADTRIGFRRVNSLSGNATLDLSDSVTISSGLAPGTYYLGIIADYTDSQTEADESNNTSAQQVTVVQ